MGLNNTAASGLLPPRRGHPVSGVPLVAAWGPLGADYGHFRRDVRLLHISCRRAAQGLLGALVCPTISCR